MKLQIGMRVTAEVAYTFRKSGNTGITYYTGTILSIKNGIAILGMGAEPQRSGSFKQTVRTASIFQTH